MPNVQMLACKTVEALRLCGFQTTPACANVDALLANPKEIARFAFALRNAPRGGPPTRYEHDDGALTLVNQLMRCMRIDAHGNRWPKGQRYTPAVPMPIEPKHHPADDPAQVQAMVLALTVRDLPVARAIGRDILANRRRHDASV